MMIRILSDQLASQIAAGEVVERPSSVVKELVENALDAGARTINVNVRGGGRDLVQIADDGYGIPSDQLETAFLRHATSKLNSSDDLNAIHTLGFRGEALAAIAAVSQLTVVSRTEDARAGTRLMLEGGQKVSRETVGAPLGTVIGVENLFYNVPARLKFLKSITTEKRLIDEFVTRYALAYPDVRFRLTHDSRITFQTTGNGNVRDVLLAIYGADTARQLLEIESQEEKPAGMIHVAGFVGPPSLHWANRNHITLFVNGRWIRDNSLTYAIIQAYHTLLPVGRYPLGVIFITVPAEQVDVNVHPAKIEVRFRQGSSPFGTAQRAVRTTLIQDSPVRNMNAWALGSQPLDQSADGSPYGWAGQLDNQAFQRRDEADQVELSLDWSQRFASAAGTELVGNKTATSALLSADVLPSTQTPPDTILGGNRLPIMRVVGQVGAAYIITEGPDGMFLIDQHAAHERILYEQFMAQWDQAQVPSQRLTVGTAVHLSPAQATLLENNLDVLTKIGFQVETFGPNAFMVRAVPAIVAKLDPAQALIGVVEDLERGDAPLQGKIEARIVLRVCKTAAIKAGQTLSPVEMEAMIQQLEACQSPHTCPHGRPTLIHLSVAQLARQFGRT